jgi:hypothetical protein
MENEIRLCGEVLSRKVGCVDVDFVVAGHEVKVVGVR